MTRRSCEYVGGCDREATRLFQAEPVNGWLCEDHFQQVLNAAAEVEAIARRKFDAEWHEHLGKYLREHNLNYAELTEAQWHQIADEAVRWAQREPKLIRAGRLIKAFRETGQGVCSALP